MSFLNNNVRVKIPKKRLGRGIGSAVAPILAENERAEAQRLQPHHIQSFFIEAFKHLGGNIKQREEGRFEIINVPVRIRERDRLIGIGTPIGKKYERISKKICSMIAKRHKPKQECFAALLNYFKRTKV